MKFRFELFTLRKKTSFLLLSNDLTCVALEKQDLYIDEEDKVKNKLNQSL